MSHCDTRRGFLTAVGTGVATALAGCGGNPPSEEPSPTAGDRTPTETPPPTDTATPTAAEAAQTGGTLRLPSVGKIQTLDPVNAKVSSAPISLGGFNQYQSSLTTFPNGRLPPVADLAADFSVSADGQTYTFELRDDVRFHPREQLSDEQRRLTASDVVYSWERLAQSSNSRNKDDIIGESFSISHEGNTSEGLDNYEPGSLAVRAEDEFTLAFDLEFPFHSTLSQISSGTFSIVPENAVGDIEGYDGIWDYQEFFGTSGDGPTFAGTGPFIVEAWSKGDRLDLSGYDDYHGEGPYVDGIEFTVLSSPTAQYQRAINQNIDIFSIPKGSFDPEKVEIERDRGVFEVGTYGPLENGETVQYGRATALRTEYIEFNTERVIRPARRALALLVNQHQIAADVYKDVNAPAYHITPPPVFPHQEGENPAEVYDRHATTGFRAATEFGANGYPWGYDESRVDEARQLMEDAGYSEEDPYELTFTVFANFNANTWDQVATLIRDLAAAAHIQIDINKADLGTIISKAIQGDLDMFSLGDDMEWPEADNLFRYFTPTVSGQFTRWTIESKGTDNEYVSNAARAWRRYEDNRGPGEVAQRNRNDAYLTFEEMIWASVGALPTVHSVMERWWYPDVNVPMIGPMGNQTFNTLWLDR